LIRQNIFELIRRCAACVVDWSEASPSVFLELWSRLAVSEWGAIQIIDDQRLPANEREYQRTQINRMRRLLGPVPYKYPEWTSDVFDRIIEEFMKRNPGLEGDKAAYNRIHRSLVAVIDTVQAAQPAVVEELKRHADALHHLQQGRDGAPQILFHGSLPAKRDSERAALEYRIAAWLYLEHRMFATLKDHKELRESYEELGRLAADALYDLGDDASIDLASRIENRLNQLKQED
jgi:hypothetical protein